MREQEWEELQRRVNERESGQSLQAGLAAISLPGLLAWSLLLGAEEFLLRQHLEAELILSEWEGIFL